MITNTFTDRHAAALANIPDSRPIPGQFDLVECQMEFVREVCRHAKLGLDDPALTEFAEIIRDGFENDERPRVVALVILTGIKWRYRNKVAKN